MIRSELGDWRRSWDQWVENVSANEGEVGEKRAERHVVRRELGDRRVEIFRLTRTKGSLCHNFSSESYSRNIAT